MAKKKKKKAATAIDLSVEEAIDELDEIVTVLETGQESLTDSLQQFERGMALLRHCHQQLDGAAQRIEVLTGITEDGEVISEPFDGRATTSRKSVADHSHNEDDAQDEDDEENSLF